MTLRGHTRGGGRSRHIDDAKVCAAVGEKDVFGRHAHVNALTPGRLRGALVSTDNLQVGGIGYIQDMQAGMSIGHEGVLALNDDICDHLGHHLALAEFVYAARV